MNTAQDLKIKYSTVIHTNSQSNHKNKLRKKKSALRLLDIFQQFNFVINQKNNIQI